MTNPLGVRNIVVRSFEEVEAEKGVRPRILISDVSTWGLGIAAGGDSGLYICPLTELKMRNATGTCPSSTKSQPRFAPVWRPRLVRGRRAFPTSGAGPLRAVAAGWD